MTPDAYFAKCPSRPIMTRLAKKWTMLALIAMQTGPRRFGELRRLLEGVSQKTLTNVLRGLEEDGLVRRVDFNETPSRVEYNLTPLGEDLAPLMKHIKTWAEENMDAIEAAQTASKQPSAF
ncbi:MAG: helix-turn-helix domain-containing protein [Pseudomonadota bacterium]